MHAAQKSIPTQIKTTPLPVGIIGHGIYNNRDISSKVVKYVNCTNNNAEGYTVPGNGHDTIVANALQEKRFREAAILTAAAQIIFIPVHVLMSICIRLKQRIGMGAIFMLICHIMLMQ